MPSKRDCLSFTVLRVVVERSPWYGLVWYGLELAVAAPESRTRWRSKHQQTSKRDLWAPDSTSTYSSKRLRPRINK